jgi:hypothetical protein
MKQTFSTFYLQVKTCRNSIGTPRLINNFYSSDMQKLFPDWGFIGLLNVILFITFDNSTYKKAFKMS